MFYNLMYQVINRQYISKSIQILEGITKPPAEEVPSEKTLTSAAFDVCDG